MRLGRLSAMVMAALVSGPAAAEEVRDAILGCMEFAPQAAGIILPARITPDVAPQVHFLDTRDAAQFDAGHIDWHEVPARLDDPPAEGLVVLCCNTGTLSARADFVARALGRENGLVLRGGCEGWKAAGR